MITQIITSLNTNGWEDNKDNEDSDSGPLVVNGLTSVKNKAVTFSDLWTDYLSLNFTKFLLFQVKIFQVKILHWNFSLSKSSEST